MFSLFLSFLFCFVVVVVGKKTVSFVVDLDDSRDIQNMQHMILKHVRSASVDALNYMNTFSKYEYIWLEDKQLYLQRFLNECERNCLEEDTDFPEDKVQDPNAQIDLFQAQVSIYLMPHHIRCHCKLLMHTVYDLYLTHIIDWRLVECVWWLCKTYQL